MFCCCCIILRILIFYFGGKNFERVKRKLNADAHLLLYLTPDAGKTTLTEKFLLYGGAIAQAGAVKGKKSARHAVSDWMEIESREEFQLLRQ